MKLNLRKAAALVTEIRNAAKEIDVKTNFAASIYSDKIEEQTSASRTKLLNDITRRNTLENAAFVVRAAIGRANAGSGINDLLAEDAYLEGVENRLKAFAAATPQEDWETFHNSVTARKASTAAGTTRSFSYSFESATDVNLLTQEDIESFASELRDIRKHRRQIKDMTVELNIRTEIEVSSDIESVLKQEGLI
jgi:hypothetical protein